MRNTKILWSFALVVLAGCVNLQESKERALQEAVDQCAAHGKLYLNDGLNIKGEDIVVSGYCLPPVAREMLEAEAAKLKDPIKTDFPNYTFVAANDRTTEYYFTKSTHRAYPWAIKLDIRRGDGPRTTNGEQNQVRWIAGIPSGASVPADARTATTVMDWMTKVVTLARATPISSPL